MNADLVVNRYANHRGIWEPSDGVALFSTRQKLETCDECWMRLVHPFDFDEGESDKHFDRAVKHWARGHKVAVVAHRQGAEGAICWHLEKSSF